MLKNNVIFVDENESTVHEQILARLVAEAMVFQIRLQKQNDNVKAERNRT